MPNPFEFIPDADFAPLSAQELLDEMVRDYERAYYEETGESISLPPSSEIRIFLYTQALRFYSAYQMIDQGCKMNLLKYSTGAYLDNLAALFGLTRLPAQPSYAKVEFTLSGPRPDVLVIPANTRVSTANKIYFATQEDLQIPAGEITVQGNVVSTRTGSDTAGILAGQLNILVDPVPYVKSSVSIEQSQGGAEIENDSGLRNRCFFFPASRSTAGPKDAYVYFVRSFSQVIESVGISSPEAGLVDIRITLTGGELPQQAFLDKLSIWLEDKRPLTDRLHISAPDVNEYEIDCTYYISREDSERQAELQKAIDTAVDEYIAWQGGQIGRNLSPDMLTKMVISAGASRIVIHSPEYMTIDDLSICRCVKKAAVYRGLE